MKQARLTAADTPIAIQIQESDEVSEWWGRSGAGAWQKLLSLQKDLAAVVDGCVQDYVRIDNNVSLSTAGKTAAFVEMRKTAFVKIDDLHEVAQKQIDLLDALIEEARGQKSIPVQEQLLQEMRLTRAWHRIRLELDGEATNDGSNNSLSVANSIKRIIGDAAEARDMAVIDALKSELPAWLRANHSEGLLPVIQPWISEAMAPFRSPIERAADVVESAGTEGWRNLSAAFVSARQYVSDTLGGDNASCILPGFAGPDVLRVSRTAAGPMPTAGAY